jgi:hypothetical protein
MSMNPEQRELFRNAILCVLEANPSRFGLTVRALTHLVAVYGFMSPQAAEIENEVVYLADKGLVTDVAKEISPENKAWRVTASGRDYLARRGMK